MTDNPIYTDYLVSTFGTLEIIADQGGLTAIRFVQDTPADTHPSVHTRQAVQQLEEYFAGQRVKFKLTLNPTGTTFQQQVWQQLLKVSYGQTCSYADIARGIDNPKAVRAVGAANGRNPLTIVVPCHRVIGSNGTLTGYAWGTDIKAGLLQLEQGNKPN
jgi:methylated-DNA-[protein]-cysteine S-methyltransferase